MNLALAICEKVQKAKRAVLGLGGGGRELHPGGCCVPLGAGEVVWSANRAQGYNNTHSPCHCSRHTAGPVTQHRPTSQGPPHLLSTRGFELESIFGVTCIQNTNSRWTQLQQKPSDSTASVCACACACVCVCVCVFIGVRCAGYTNLYNNEMWFSGLHWQEAMATEADVCLE